MKNHSESSIRIIKPLVDKSNADNWACYIVSLLMTIGVLGVRSACGYGDFGFRARKEELIRRRKPEEEDSLAQRRTIEINQLNYAIR